MVGTLIYATVFNFRWRLVIHGGIDGFSMMIVFLKCSTNNMASTVRDCFLQAVVRSFGLPLRVRSDKGGESVDIARYMLSHPLRGPGRGSHIAGRKGHNQRIERLWRDLFCGCLHLYYNLFYAMENCEMLDPSDELHLFALHFVYVPRINQTLQLFAQGHNRALIFTERGKSPLQLWISSSVSASNQGIDDFWIQVWKVHLSIILRGNVREGKGAWKDLLEFWIMLHRNRDFKTCFTTSQTHRWVRFWHNSKPAATY